MQRQKEQSLRRQRAHSWSLASKANECVLHHSTRALWLLLRNAAATQQRTWNLWPGLKSNTDVTIFLSEQAIEAVVLTLVMYLERQLNMVLEIRMMLENLGHIVAIVIASQLNSLERAAGWS